jgi:hypothetical protein
MEEKLEIHRQEHQEEEWTRFAECARTIFAVYNIFV